MRRHGNVEEPHQPDSGVGDYSLIDTADAWWHVSTEMARVIDAQLTRRRPPEWVTFVDLVGARRAFHRALKREHSEDSYDD